LQRARWRHAPHPMFSLRTLGLVDIMSALAAVVPTT
jgi:hypothetical protein